MKLSEIQHALERCETVPTRSLGQNFLHDQNLARWIVGSLQIQPGDHVIEIGPGLDALTENLAAHDIRLTLIERTPFFPASGLATRSFNGLHPEANS